MNKTSPYAILGFILVAAMLIFSHTAFNQPVKHAPPRPVQDTIPAPKPPRDFEDIHRELDKASRELRKHNWKQMEEQIEQSLNQINKEKLQADIEKQMKELDFSGLRRDMQQLKADMENLRKEFKQEKITFDAQKMEAEISSLQKINLDKMEEQIKAIELPDFSALEKQLKDLRPQLEKSMADAEASLSQLKKEMQAYETFVHSLHEDNLLDKNGSYEIDYNGTTLKVNGKIQPAALLEKHKTFLNREKKFNLKKDGSGLHIQKD